MESTFELHYGFNEKEECWLPLQDIKNCYRFKGAFVQLTDSDGIWYKMRGNFSLESIEINWGSAYYLVESKSA